MNRKKRIESILKKKLFEFSFIVEDVSNLHKGHNNFDGNSETHFKIIIKSKDKKQYNRLQIHQKIYHFLNEEFKKGLHALEIKTKN